LAETGILLRQSLARSSGEAEIDLSGITAAAWHTDDQVGSSVAIHITNDWNVGLAIGLDGAVAVSTGVSPATAAAAINTEAPNLRMPSSPWR
jgi:hypothetical protein